MSKHGQEYNERDHRHCPSTNSPCGFEGAHRCCLCGLPEMTKTEYDAPCGHCMTPETYEKRTPAPGVEEVVHELNELALSRATSINGVLVQMWDRTVLTAYIEKKLTTHQQEKEALVRELCDVATGLVTTYGRSNSISKEQILAIAARYGINIQ